MTESINHSHLPDCPRPVGKPKECFYCQEQGNNHLRDCPSPIGKPDECFYCGDILKRLSL